jgi:hypothetical protein
VKRTDIAVGRCYRTAAQELRQIVGVTPDTITFVVLFEAAGWTSVGPRQRLSPAVFRAEIVDEVPRPPKGRRRF